MPFGLNDPQLFLGGSTLLVWWSRKPLGRPGSHGFYRFYAWEAILGLLVLNHGVWGEDPYSLHQFASWMLVLLSAFLVVAGLATLYLGGGHRAGRRDGALYGFEKTDRLVSRGIFGLIRHPMYASLLALAWGAFLQAPGPVAGILLAAACAALWLTAMADERECLAYFGQPYADYMRRTRRFIPWLL